MSNQETKGYLIAATLSRSFYDAAVECIISLKDEVPDAQVAFFTHDDWVQDEHRYLFDHLFTPCPVHNRTKLWALDKTPFDVTMYIDADCYVITDEITEVFDHMENAGPDVDILMSENRPYNAKVVYFQSSEQSPDGEARELQHYKDEHVQMYKDGIAEKFRWHCGVFVWRKNDKTQKLWKEWLRYYRNHNETEDKEGCDPYPRSLAYWDTFAFWRVLKEQPELGINIQRLPKDAKYNFVIGYRPTEIRYGEEIAVQHYTIPPSLVRQETRKDETALNATFGSIDILR